MIFGITISLLFVVCVSFLPWFASFYYYSSNILSYLINSVCLYLIFTFPRLNTFSLYSFFDSIAFLSLSYSCLVRSWWNLNSSFFSFSDVFICSFGFSSFYAVSSSFYSPFIVSFNSFSWFFFSYYSLGKSFLYSFSFFSWSVGFSVNYGLFIWSFMLFLFFFVCVSYCSTFLFFVAIPTYVVDFFSSGIDFFSFNCGYRVLGSFLYDFCSFIGYDYLFCFYVFFLFFPLFVYILLNYVFDDFLFLNTSDSLNLYWQDYYYFGCSYFYFFDSYSYFGFMFFSDLDFFFGHDYCDFYWYFHSFFIFDYFFLFSHEFTLFFDFGFVTPFVSSGNDLGFFCSVLASFMFFSLWFTCDFFGSVSLSVFIWFDSLPFTLYGSYSFLRMLHVIVLFSERIYLDEILLWSRVYSNCLVLYYYFYEVLLYFVSSGFSVSVSSWSCYIWSVFCNFYCFVFTSVGFTCSNYDYGVGQFCSFLVSGLLSNFFWTDVFLFSGVLLEGGDSCYIYYNFGAGTCFIYQFVGSVYNSLGGFFYSSMFFSLRFNYWLQLHFFSSNDTCWFYLLICFSLLFFYYFSVSSVHFHFLS